MDAADNAVHIAHGHALPQLNVGLYERIRGVVCFVYIPVESRQQIVCYGLRADGALNLKRAARGRSGGVCVGLVFLTLTCEIGSHGCSASTLATLCPMLIDKDSVTSEGYPISVLIAQVESLSPNGEPGEAKLPLPCDEEAPAIRRTDSLKHITA